jgi:uncharacterized ParB-like nuclease family protein
MGIITDALRRPLLPLDEPSRVRLMDVMATVGVMTTPAPPATTGLSNGAARTGTTPTADAAATVAVA